MWPVGNRVRSSRAAHLPGFYLAQAVRSARPFIPVVVLSVVPYTSFHDDRFRKGIPPSIVQPVRPFGPGTAPASPRRFRRGPLGWCPVPLPVSVPPSPARLAAWPLGAWPARSAPALPVSRWRGRGLAWPWGGASRPGARGPLPALRPRASRGVRGRGVPWRPSRRGPRRLAAWRPAHHHPAPGVVLGAPVRGPWRPPWPLAPPLGRCGPSVPPPLGRGGGVASVAFPRWPVGAPVGASRGRGARGLASGVPGRRGGGWSRCQGVPRPPWGRGVASVVNELSAPGVVSRPLGPVGASHPRTA